jgi:RNA polymerase sigma-70 factor (ECF subfamily)
MAKQTIIADEPSGSAPSQLAEISGAVLNTTRSAANPDLSGKSQEPTVGAAIEAELALIQRICDGDRAAFYELVQPYERAVYRAAFSILQNEGDAEDVAQEAVLKAFTHLKSFRRESKFSTWLIQITINEARMRLRKDRRNLYESIDAGVDNEEGDYIPKDFADWRQIPSEQLEHQRLREALQKAIASLAPKYQEVFILRDVENVNIADTAKALGITEASVKTRLLRARLQMRDALAPGFDGGWTGNEGNWKKVRPW